MTSKTAYMTARLRRHAAWIIRTARKNGGGVSLPSEWDQRAADIAAHRGNGVVHFWGGSKPVFTLNSKARVSA